MTTATLPHSAAVGPRNTGELAGTGQLLRLCLRRDRIVAPLWILLLSLPLGPVYIESIESVYATAAERHSFMESIMASPAQRAMYGVIYNDSLGATGIWKAGMFHTLIGVAVILTVIRHTRTEEETGRTELVDSTAVGRLAGLAAALIVGGGSALLTGLIGTAGLLGTGVPAAGSIAFGTALAGSGLVFTAVAAVAAQLSAQARTARGIAFGVLGAGYALRAAGDAGNGVLTWLAPQGWSLQMRPYAGERWWVPLLHIGTTLALTGLAVQLARRRDVGAGLLADRPGPATASAALAGPFGLAWRIQRGTLITATAGLLLYALLIGSVVHGIGNELGDSRSVRDMVARIGGSQVLEDAFISIAFTMLAVGAAALGISSVLRLHQAEQAGRAETVLAGSVSRTSWATSHLALALSGTGLAMAAAGLVAGIVYGAAAGDIGAALPRVLGAALVQVPAVWLFAAAALALFGLVPRFAPVAWGLLVGAVAMFLLGSISGVPQWVLDLAPFAQVPKVPAEPMRWAPIGWLLLIDAALIAAGLVGLRRRDLR